MADNSLQKYPRADVDYIAVEAGSGISKSRNAALERVRTPYMLLVDDDHVRLDSFWGFNDCFFEFWLIVFNGKEVISVFFVLGQLFLSGYSAKGHPIVYWAICCK